MVSSRTLSDARGIVGQVFDASGCRPYIGGEDSCVNVENHIVTPPVSHLSIGMHQGVSLAHLGRQEGLLNLFNLSENT